MANPNPSPNLEQNAISWEDIVSMNSRPASHMDTMEGGGGAAREGSGRPSAGPFATESEAESEPFEAGEEVTLPLPPTPTPTPTPNPYPYP